MLISFREREREGEKGGEKHQLERNIASPMHLTGDQTRNLGTCPDWSGTRNLPVYGAALSHAGQGWTNFLKRILNYKSVLTDYMK